MLRHDLDSNERELRNREHQIKQLQELLAQERAKLAENEIHYERQITELKQAIDNIYASTSWKITAPLRRANLLLKNKSATS